MLAMAPLKAGLSLPAAGIASNSSAECHDSYEASLLCVGEHLSSSPAATVVASGEQEQGHYHRKKISGLEAFIDSLAAVFPGQGPPPAFYQDVGDGWINIDHESQLLAPKSQVQPLLLHEQHDEKMETFRRPYGRNQHMNKHDERPYRGEEPGYEEHDCFISEHAVQ